MSLLSDIYNVPTSDLPSLDGLASLAPLALLAPEHRDGAAFLLRRLLAVGIMANDYTGADVAFCVAEFTAHGLTLGLRLSEMERAIRGGIDRRAAEARPASPTSELPLPPPVVAWLADSSDDVWARELRVTTPTRRQGDDVDSSFAVSLWADVWADAEHRTVRAHCIADGEGPTLQAACAALGLAFTERDPSHDALFPGAPK